MQSEKTVALINEVNAGFAVTGEKVRGVAVATRDGNEYSVRISLINLAALEKGCYKLYFDAGKTETYDISSSGGIFRTENIDGAAFVVAYSSADGETAVAYGSFSKNGRTVKEVLENAKNMRSVDEVGNAAEKNNPPDESYDDEVVATENYYAYADVDENLRLKENVTDEHGGDNENGNAETAQEREEEKETYNFGIYGDEAAEKPFGGNYFDKVKGEIDKLFENFPEEKELAETVPDSKWVKVDYDEGKFYVVGIIYDGKKPLYICYGVAGRYGEKPEEIKEYCSFIPSSPFRLKGDGYWVMYQDASTGKCLTT